MVADQAGLLQRAGDDRDSRPTRTEHHGHEFLREGELMLADTIMRQQQPPGETLFDRMKDVAGC